MKNFLVFAALFLPSVFAHGMAVTHISCSIFLHDPIAVSSEEINFLNMNELFSPQTIKKAQLKTQKNIQSLRDIYVLTTAKPVGYNNGFRLLDISVTVFQGATYQTQVLKKASYGDQLSFVVDRGSVTCTPVIILDVEE